MEQASQQTETDRQFDIVCVGMGPQLMAQAETHLKGMKIQKLETADEFIYFLDMYQLAEGTTVLVSSCIKGMEHIEVSQALSSSFPGIEVLFITDTREHFDLSVLKKNGFSECFFLPSDAGLMKEHLEEIRIAREGGAVRRYKAVKLIDINADDELPFEVRTFLPMNKKYVLISGSGRLNDKKLQMLRDKLVNNVYVDREQMDKFYDFTAKRLIVMNEKSENAVSETERSEKLRGTVRGLFRSILDTDDRTNNFDSGRNLLEQSRKVIELYVQTKTGVDLRKRLADLAGEGNDYYNHARTVSTIAALLSMGTGFGKPEDLAIAGLFHDIGMLGIHEEISPFSEQTIADETYKLYQQHPQGSVNLLREKMISVTPEIANIIECHHERIDKTGFPNQLPEHKIPVEAHILAYADAFEYLSRPREGQERMSADQIHAKIQNELGLMPQLLAQIKKVLM